MISNNDSSLFSLLLRKSVIDPRTILQTCHKNCMYKINNELTEKTFTEVSTQCQSPIDTCKDEQTQVSQSNQSRDTQTCYVYSPISIKKHRQFISFPRKQQISNKKYTFIHPYAMIDRVNQGEQFLKFLYKQNCKLNLIYSTFRKNLLKYTDRFLLALQQPHCLYGIFREDMIRYMILLQEYIHDLRAKMNILEEGNKNFALFLKHFHKITRSKSELEDLLNKHQKQVFDQNESVKDEQQFFEIYQRSYIHLRTIEQQRLLAIREQMRFAMSLTVTSADNSNLFTSNNFDNLLNIWDHQHTISIDHWSHFPRKSHVSQQAAPVRLLDEIKHVVDEYYNQRQTISNDRHTTLVRMSDRLMTIKNSNDEFVERMDSITSHLTQSRI